MKHWLWYTTNGELGGDIIHQDGWGSQDLNDAGTSDPLLISIRATYTVLPDFSAFISFSCACVSGFCQCASEKVRTDRVNLAGPSLEAKPTFTIKLDAVAVASGSKTDKTPGATVNLTLETLTGTIPDGTIVEVIDNPNSNAVDMLQTSPALLTFTGGATNTVALLTPAAGVTGVIALVAQDRWKAVQGSFKIRGW